MGGDWLSNSFQKATDLLQVNLPMACSKTVFNTGKSFHIQYIR